MPLYVSVVGEGTSDIAVATHLCRHVGIGVASTYPVGGKPNLDRSLAAYNQAARYSSWLVMRDLDNDARCAPELSSSLLHRPSKGMLFRIAVRSVESWLIADALALASFLRVRVAAIPTKPDSLGRPKRALVDIARKSKSRLIRDEMVPPPGHGEVGPGYSLRIIEFVGSHWSPARASSSSDSLARCIRAIQVMSKAK